MDKCKNYHARDAGIYTAFIYAGALLSQALRNNPQLLEAWGGHSGFVWYASSYAHVIAQWLDERAPTGTEDWPGVIQYELFEPMGEWLVQLSPQPSADTVLAHFEIEYISWIAKGELERN